MMAWLMAILAGLVGSLHAQNYQLRPPGPVVFPTSRPVESCLAYQATCNSGQCIDRSQVCDGNRDCSDGSDESGCRPYNECEPNELQCSNKKCILKTWRCDGDDDCGDGSDEADCRENDPESPCRYYEWQCASEDQCIPKSFHCDGEMDCQDQSDEIGCRFQHLGTFHHEDSRHSINKFNFSAGWTNSYYPEQINISHDGMSELIKSD